MGSATPIEFSILIPCLNEAETIQICVAKAKNALSRVGIQGEVLVADNGSTDGSDTLAIAAGARVIHVAQRGYGAALIGGIDAALGEYIIMGDADDSYDFSAIDPFIEQLRGGVQLVIGSRLKGTILSGAMPHLHRWIGNPLLTLIGNVFFHTHVSDYHCGLRGFHRESIQKLNLRTFGMELATEMIAKAALCGLSISEVPITYYPDGRSRHPHLRTWQDGWRHLKFMLMLSPLWLFIVPGSALNLLGILGYIIVLVDGNDQMSRLSLQLIASIALIIGSQLLSFGLLSRLFSIKFGLLPSKRIWESLADSLSINNGLIAGGFVLFVSVLIILQAMVTGNVNSLVPGLLVFVFGTKIISTSFAVSMIRLTDYFK